MNKEILEENVFYYKNAIPDPKKLVDIIESTEFEDYGNSISKWQEWAACSGEHYVYGTEKTLYPTEDEKIADPNTNKISYIFNTIDKALYDVAKDYALSKGDTDEPLLFPVFPIKKYSAGTFMGAHFDQQEGDKRLKYSLVAYLNDDYEGGEISFSIKSPDAPIFEGKPKEELDLNEKDSGIFTFAIKPEAGSIIIFPSSPPYHHTAHLVKNGFKYMVPTHWMHSLS